MVRSPVLILSGCSQSLLVMGRHIIEDGGTSQARGTTMPCMRSFNLPLLTITRATCAAPSPSLRQITQISPEQEQLHYQPLLFFFSLCYLTSFYRTQSLGSPWLIWCSPFCPAGPGKPGQPGTPTTLSQLPWLTYRL